jgi:phosphohistidine phosphatase
LVVNIYLVRHGEAASERDDPTRPLTPLGREEVGRVARMAAAKDVRVSAVFHSGILRAKQTAEILAEHLPCARGVAELSGLSPQEDPALAKAELEAAESPMMLVGHLPHLNRLVALLVKGDPEAQVINLSPASMVCCCKDKSNWEIAWTLTPESSKA